MDKIPTKLQIGAIAVVAIICGCIIFTIKFFETIQRIPEFPFEELIRQQQNALKEGWVNDAIPEIETDSDLTWASRAIFTGFSYNNGLAYLSEEIHVFSNSLRANIIKSPSPLSVFSDNNYVPKEWRYTPEYADNFQLGCYDGDFVYNPDFCLVVTQYSEFCFVFYLPIGENISLNELMKLLDITDSFMNDYLNASTVRMNRFP